MPGPEWIGVVNIGLVRDEVLDKRGTPRPAVDPTAEPTAELSIERDGSIQQQRRGGRVLKVARIHERFVHGGKVVCIGIQTGANTLDVAKRCKELERAGKKAFPVK